MKINSCNVKDVANPDCCPNATDIGDREVYIIKCEIKNREVTGEDRFPFPNWCPLPEKERKSA